MLWLCILASVRTDNGYLAFQSSMSTSSSSTIAKAGLKTSVTAFALTFAVMVAASAFPSSAGWLCEFNPIWKTPSARCITFALQD